MLSAAPWNARNIPFEIRNVSEIFLVNVESILKMLKEDQGTYIFIINKKYF